MGTIQLGTPSSPGLGSTQPVILPSSVPADEKVLIGVQVISGRLNEVTVGNTRQIPFVNSTNNDFAYDNLFTYNSSSRVLSANNISISGSASLGSLTMGVSVNTIETSLTNDDTHLPTSGAVVDAIAAATGGNFTGQVTSSGLVTSLHISAITGQIELTSGLISTDEVLVNDGGVLKRADISFLQAYMQSNLVFGGSYVHPNHTGQVTSTGDGATALTALAITAQSSSTIVHGISEFLMQSYGYIQRLTTSNLLSYLNSHLTLGTTYTHPNHTGQVTSTGDGATALTSTAVSAHPSSTIVDGISEFLMQNYGYIQKLTINNLVSFLNGKLSFEPTLSLSGTGNRFLYANPAGDVVDLSWLTFSGTGILEIGTGLTSAHLSLEFGGANPWEISADAATGLYFHIYSDTYVTVTPTLTTIDTGLDINGLVRGYGKAGSTAGSLSTSETQILSDSRITNAVFEGPANGTTCWKITINYIWGQSGGTTPSGSFIIKLGTTTLASTPIITVAAAVGTVEFFITPMSATQSHVHYKHIYNATQSDMSSQSTTLVTHGTGSTLYAYFDGGGNIDWDIKSVIIQGFRI